MLSSNSKTMDINMLQQQASTLLWWLSTRVRSGTDARWQHLACSWRAVHSKGVGGQGLLYCPRFVNRSTAIFKQESTFLKLFPHRWKHTLMLYDVVLRFTLIGTNGISLEQPKRQRCRHNSGLSCIYGALACTHYVNVFFPFLLHSRK